MWDIVLEGCQGSEKYVQAQDKPRLVVLQQGPGVGTGSPAMSLCSFSKLKQSFEKSVRPSRVDHAAAWKANQECTCPNIRKFSLDFRKFL